MKNYDEDGAAMLQDYLIDNLQDYLSVYITLCDNCPVNKIEQYKTGQYQHIEQTGNCSKVKPRCYELADRIIQTRGES